MKLYTYFQSSGAYRVRIALALKGLLGPDVAKVEMAKVEMAYIDLTKAQQKDPAYTALNPQQLVPALVTDGGQVLTQSLAIIEYIDETRPTPPLLPKDAVGRAQVRAIAQAMACDIAPINNLRQRKYVKEVFGSDEKTWIQHWTHLGLTAVEALVARTAGDFCYGNAPGLADCVLVPQLFHARRFGCDLAAYPTLTRIDATCNALPAFIAAHPAQQADAT